MCSAFPIAETEKIMTELSCDCSWWVKQFFLFEEIVLFYSLQITDIYLYHYIYLNVVSVSPYSYI